MLIRIRLLHQRSRFPKRQSPRKHQALALALASLLTPGSLLAFTVAFWRIAADLRWTGEFFISQGILSHWQTWLGASALLLALASILNKWGHSTSRPTQRSSTYSTLAADSYDTGADVISQRSARLQEIVSHSTE